MIIQEISQKIVEHGGRCFYVGGYVRDKVLGINANDIDIECFHISLETLEQILNDFGPVLTVGKSFGILKLANHPEVDFALPRTETKVGTKHTDFAIDVQPDITYKKAASRRDFTCNALMQDTLTDEILDYFNGVQDITDKTIRHVADATFTEDALRGLRAAQFAARLDFTIHPGTIQLIQSLDYSAISQERIQDEFYKGICSNNPRTFLESLDLLSITPKCFPELQALSASQRSMQYAMLTYAVKHAQNTFTARAVLTSYYLTPARNFLIKITNDKRTQKEITTYLAALHRTTELTDDRSLRELKQIIPNWHTYHQLLQCIYQYDKDILPTTFVNITTLQEKYALANGNNPTNTPLIQGRDLIALGLHPTTHFKDILTYAHTLELDGYTKKDILHSISNKYLK